MKKKQRQIPQLAKPDTPEPALNVRNFYGTVILKEYTKTIGGLNTQHLRGFITIYRDEEGVGFRTKGNEANWFARIGGASGSTSYNVLGCQIRAVVAHPVNAPCFDECHIVP